jgi:magnesium transporter
MSDRNDMTATAPADELRDEDGAIRADFLDRISSAIERGDAEALSALAGDLHEADTGDLLEALDPDRCAPA